LGLPTGTVTFLFTDIEGSTELWESDEASARQVLIRHDQIIEGLVEENEGMLVRPRGEGDSRFAVFQHAPGAAASAAAIQRAFIEESWPTVEPLKIRMGLHTGHADLREGDYYGSAVNRCARVRSLGHGGQVLLSLATEQVIADYLPEQVELVDLGLHPLKGLKRHEQIFQMVIPDVPSEFPPLETQAGPKHNLPEQLTPFVGRQSEIEEVRALLAKDGVRLVTLKGPGGMGKTRLAIEVAGQEVESYADGARFVALAPLDSADQIVQAFIQALDLRPASQEDPRDLLLQHLRRADLLIVVDNFEHILDGAPLTAEILEHAPNVRILATSRERLSLRGESVFDVTGLEFSDWQTVEQALSSSCAQLFVHGALQVQPHFELEGSEVVPLARICRLVEGTPLALLLSAGWMDMLSLAEIADEVESSLDFLETELQDAPDRQRSIKAVFEGSWGRLGEPEQQLFIRLSVFRGGFTREAAQEVAGASIKSLARLADKSFIRRDPETARYEIHELLRQYGEQRLRPPVDDEARAAHAQYFAELLATQNFLLTDPRQGQVLDEMEADIENIRRACRRLAATGRDKELEGMLHSLWAFHEIRGWLHPGMELFTDLESALRASLDDLMVVSQLEAMQAWITVVLGFPEQGLIKAQQSLDWLREHGYSEETHFALLTIAVSNVFLQNPTQAVEIGQELYEMGRSNGKKWWVLNGLSLICSGSLVIGDVERATETAELYGSLADDPWNRYWQGQARAGLELARGDLAAALAIYESLLEPLLEISYPRGLQYTYTNMGRTSFQLEQFWEAEMSYGLSLRYCFETGQIRETLANLTDIARVWSAQGRGSEAVQMLATVLQQPEIGQNALFRPASIGEEAETLSVELKEELESDEYQASWEKGSSEELEDAVIRILKQPMLQSVSY
jgi:predicted ATPase/class 3 adenylate cyclase